ncbi:hypothetical protein GCM10010411_75190 [Actinomadura fulvescens]|uniref:Uncharacterized protein n=1 Tax=Actinomadura fulvescens TaxID=46160 RepID=A0ABN3QI28_9ACTN
MRSDVLPLDRRRKQWLLVTVRDRAHMNGLTLEETTDYLRHHVDLAGRADRNGPKTPPT